MTLRTISLVAFFSMIASAAPAQQPALSPPLVSTSGTAVIRVVPDLVDIRFEVEIRNADLTIARQEQSERALKVLAALRSAGIAETELQSSHVRISPNYTEFREETEKVKFYSVSQDFSCTLTDLKKLPDLIAAALAAGVTRVGSGDFRTSEVLKHREEARLKAIRAAKEKAITLAAQLGATVGKPYSIRERTSRENNDWEWSGGLTSNFVGTPAVTDIGTSSIFAPGTVDVSETVEVSFVLE